MKNDRLINIGKIIGVFGIKGELKIYSESGNTANGSI